MDALQTRIQRSLSDRYRLDRELGRGGMAVVYLADDLKHQRQVAIKVLKPELLPALGSERFLREIQIAARLAHPNILPLHDSGESDGLLYYVMPYVQGETLRSRMKREKRLPLEQALAITAEVADALGYAHSQGLVHRDIKPENVLFQAGHAVVADFGIARAVSQASGEHLTESGLAVGTLAYMSPEQASGAQHLDGRTDIYSLGCVLYEMLTGRPPLLSPAISAHPSEDGVAVGEGKGAIPRAVTTVLARAVAARAADRFATAEQFKEALQGAATRTGVATPRGMRVLRRHPWRTAAAMLLLGLLALLPQTRRLGRRLLGVAPSPKIIKLAVLPFRNLMGNPDQEYLSDGLTEEMTSQLGRLHPQELMVIAQGSAARYKRTTESIRQIGDELGAQYVLEGSARREADTVRVTGELVRVSDQATVWTDSYQREITGILALESDVARAVARSLALVLLPGERARLAQARPVNAQVYEDYLRGREHARTLRPTELNVAQQYFEDALKEDSTYALAWVGLAFVWELRLQMGVLSPAFAAPKAKAAVNRALALDSTLAEAHYELAIIKSQYDWDWPGALAEFKKALAINPNLAEAHAFYAHNLMFLGRQDQAMAEMQRALELDPRNNLIHTLYAVVLEAGKRYDDAIQEADSVLNTDPLEVVAIGVLNRSYAAKGMFREAFAVARSNIMQRKDSVLLAAFDHGYAQGGYKGAYRARAQILAGRPHAAPAGVALMFLIAGDTTREFEWLERAYEERDPNLPYVAAMPVYDVIRDDPRFQDLMRRMGLPAG